MRRLLSFLALVAAAPLAAQTATSIPASKPAATITTADMARRIGILADDSMLGRDTPSRGLELTAQYIADEFKRFGLTPGGEDGSWFQRYPITRQRLDPAASRVVFAAANTADTASLERDALYLGGTVPDSALTAPVLLLAGPITLADVEQASIADKLVLFVIDHTQPPAEARQVSRAVQLARPAAIVVVTNADSAAFAARLPYQTQERTVIDLGGRPAPTVLQVHERAVTAALQAAGLDPAEVRGSTTAIVREVPELNVRIELKDVVVSSHAAPNVIGIVEGSDPKLKDEYVVFSAHMDHVGVRPGSADSIYNGADDNASGTSGVIELAEAFSRPGARPKRSVMFITVSGEEKGLWGSRYFSEHPTVPVENIVANINIDMIGRNWTDTIVAIGKEHSDLGATLERVNAAHPELGLSAIDDIWPEERFYFRSDHYNFARKGVPILFFFNGVHEDYHQPSDEPAAIDAEKASRVVRLLYFLGKDIADSPDRPKWNPESRKEIVEGPAGR